MWGLGGLTFGLTVRYFGMSLGMGVVARPTPRWLAAGDKVEIEMERIGRLINPVAEER